MDHGELAHGNLNGTATAGVADAICQRLGIQSPSGDQGACLKGLQVLHRVYCVNITYNELCYIFSLYYTNHGGVL